MGQHSCTKLLRGPHAAHDSSPISSPATIVLVRHETNECSVDIGKWMHALLYSDRLLRLVHGSGVGKGWGFMKDSPPPSSLNAVVSKIDEEIEVLF